MSKYNKLKRSFYTKGGLGSKYNNKISSDLDGNIFDSNTERSHYLFFKEALKNSNITIKLQYKIYLLDRPDKTFTKFKKIHYIADFAFFNGDRLLACFDSKNNSVEDLFKLKRDICYSKGIAVYFNTTNSHKELLEFVNLLKKI